MSLLSVPQTLSALVVFGLVLVSCGGDSSDPGVSGTNGTAGTGATGGASGQSGTSGAGGTGGASGSGGTAGVGGTSGSAGTGGTQPGDLTGAWQAGGFQVQNGKFQLIDISDCCAPNKSCAGNNPSSPYSSYYVPRAPGQSVANPNEDAEGLSNTYRLRADEAVVWVGETPPKAAYFGFTDYLMSRDDGTGQRTPVFASLGETTNNAVIAVDGPADGPKFGKTSMIIHAADKTVAEQVRASALAAGVPPYAINISPIDSVNTRLGIDDADDTFGVLFRVALFEDSTAGTTWLATPPASVYRLTPTASLSPAQPYPQATSRPKDQSNDENSTYAAAVEELKQAILAAHSTTHTSVVEDVSEGTPDPYACIAGSQSCAGDNRDTIYPATGAFLWLPKPTDFIVVFGVNHAATGKATYASASVYALDHLFGVAAVTSEDWAGSAEQYLPNHPLADKLYAYKLARDCAGDPFCLDIPEGTCPDGIDPGKVSVIAFRAYLEPASNTAPLPAHRGSGWSDPIQDKLERFSGSTATAYVLIHSLNAGHGSTALPMPLWFLLLGAFAPPVRLARSLRARSYLSNLRTARTPC